MQELTEAPPFCPAKSGTGGAEGIPANSRDVNRSTRRKNSGREQRPGVVAGKTSMEGGHRVFRRLLKKESQKFDLTILWMKWRDYFLKLFGNATVNFDPLFISDSTDIAPLCILTISFTIDSPSPVPGIPAVSFLSTR